MSTATGPSAALVDLPLRADLRGSTPYGAPQIDVAVRLNTNENSYDLGEPVATALTEALATQVRQLNRYPDREFTVLREALADYLNREASLPAQLTAKQIWAANGSNEVLMQILQAFGGPGRSALGFTPTYSMHSIIAATTATPWRGEHRQGLFELTPDLVGRRVREHDPDVIFLCSPNNPTGTALSLDCVVAAYEASDHAMVVVDEAYAEFRRPDSASAITVLPGRPRLVVTRTMSKAFALAGVRLGYLAADPAVCDALRLVRLPYHLSSLTQAAAVAALQHAPALLGTVDAVKAQRDRIVTELTGLGLVVVPSDANFVLFGGLADAPAIWQGLLDRGVLIRDVGLPGYLRVTAGTPDETSAFLAALRHTLEETP